MNYGLNNIINKLQILKGVKFSLWRCTIPSVKDGDKERVNDEITAAEVRLIDDNGQALGILSLHEAIDAARDKGLDLVEVAANAKPPVCRIMDYSKYKFEKNKKEKEARKKQRQHQVDIKEIKFRPKIEEHDYNVKLKHIRRFLTDGDKVKIVIRYRGREIMFLDSGTELLNKISLDVEDLGAMEKKPEILGKQQMMIIAPKAAK